MSWKVMSPVEVCDLMDLWASASWPLSEDEVQQSAVRELGWTIEVEDGKSYLMNTVSGFTIPDVMVVGYEGVTNYVSLRVSDTVRPVTDESTMFLSDAFALNVREGERRWGAPLLRDVEGATVARWNVGDGSRVEFTRSSMGLSARFETPQGAAVERRLGD